MIAKEITETSWIVVDNNQINFGLLTRFNRRYTLIRVSDDNPISYYSNKEELLNELPDLKFEKREVLDQSKIIFVGEFPVKYHEIFDPKPDDNPPSFLKTENGVRYAAGFYGILFDDYMVWDCPKISTLDSQNGWIGPFKSPFEAHTQVSLYNKRLKNGQ